nr:MAG TPA: hypothetical protein [Caudoviricetes sp.]DAV24069.1 MAG TPA: hypothetical protein [Caudoviricetes sp.]
MPRSIISRRLTACHFLYLSWRNCFILMWVNPHRHT